MSDETVTQDKPEAERRTNVRRSTIEPGERGVVEGGAEPAFEEQFYDKAGVLHNPRDGQGKVKFNARATSEIQKPDASFEVATGITPEQGVPQPGPALDALHRAGAIDDEGHAQRQRQIERPAAIADEERQAAAERRGVDQRRREAEERIIGQKIDDDEPVHTQAGMADGDDRRQGSEPPADTRRAKR